MKNNRKFAIELHYAIRQKTKIDFLAEKLIPIKWLLKFLPLLLFSSPILIYHWIRHKLQPSFDTIASIDDSTESVYGFTQSWYDPACVHTPIKLVVQYFDVTTFEETRPKENRFLVNFNVVKIQSMPENEALNKMLFTEQSFKYKQGVLLQRINTACEKWELIYYDLTTNEAIKVEKFKDYFKFSSFPKTKNGKLILQGYNEKQKIELRISTIEHNH